MHASSISENRASDHRHSLNKYESRDHITEQVKRVVPRKGKGFKREKKEILYQSYKFNKLCNKLCIC